MVSRVRVHAFWRWIYDKLEYQPDRDKALTLCGRVVYGVYTDMKDGNLKPDKITCKICLNK